MSERMIVIESLPQDIHVHAILWAMKKKNVHAVPLFASNFPSRSEMSIKIDQSGDWRIRYDGAESCFELNSLTEGVYVARRGASPMPDPGTHRDDRAAAGMENTAALHALRDVMATATGMTSVNAAAAKRLADRKPLQLIVAAQVGFPVPESLFSNSWSDVRQFAENKPDGFAYKSYTPVSWKAMRDGVLTTSMSYTSLILGDDIEDPSTVRRASGIYQQYLKKDYEVRTVVMGSACFSSRLESQQNEAGVIDWRRGQDSMASFRIDTPAEVERKCIAYMRQLGLLFGCFDFVVDESGVWTFLECNEQGQWLWQEATDPSLPLLDAYANFLLMPVADYRYSPGSDECSFREYEQSSWFSDSMRSHKTNVTFESGWVTVEAGSQAAEEQTR